MEGEPTTGEMNGELSTNGEHVETQVAVDMADSKLTVDDNREERCKEIPGNEQDFSGLNILELPPEMILRIFIHVDIRTIFKTVILTCKAFHQILTATDIWKTIFALKWEQTKIHKDYEYIKTWRDVYFAYDDINNFWTRKDKWALQCKKVQGHSATVDAVHIMPGLNFAVSGSRDRSAVVWDIRDFLQGDEKDEEIKEAVTLLGHKGWVWSVASDIQRPHEVITSSWDQKIKIWDLNRSGENTETYKYHPAAVLALFSQEDLLYTGCYDKTVRIFDPKSNGVQEVTKHKGPVLSLIIDRDMIISGSEDKTIHICDRRMMAKNVTSVNIGSRVLCMNLAHEQGFSYLRAGSLNGKLQTYDTTDQSFLLLDSYQLWEGHKVQKLENFHGAFIACSSTGFFKAYTPDRELKLLQTYHEHSNDISSAHSRNDVFVTGNCDDAIGFWKFNTV